MDIYKQTHMYTKLYMCVCVHTGMCALTELAAHRHTNTPPERCVHTLVTTCTAWEL